MINELRGPIIRFLVVTVGLTAYVVARVLTGTTAFPPSVVWVLAIGSAGGLVLTLIYLIRHQKHEPGPSVLFSLIVSAVSFAVVFGITWLISA